MNAESLKALKAIRHDLHAHPELAFAERRTADTVAAVLAAAGVEVHRGLGGTGVVGVIRAGDSPRMIGLRADMDALPIREHNEFAHRSTVEGHMHACGHDGHTTMLLGAARALAAARDFDGSVALIFQPAEEGGGGGLAMIEDGILERFPLEKVFGMHNWPGLPAGHFAVHSGPVMAGNDRFDIRIQGRGGHAAMPHLTTDPIVAGAALVEAIQTIVARTLDPQDVAVVAVTGFHAGEVYNALPGEAKLSGTFRAFSPTVRETVHARLRELCAGMAAAFGVSIDFELLPGYPPTINTAAEAVICADVARAVAGEDAVLTDARPSMAAEDFAYFLQRRPGAYVWIGNGAATGGCALHNASYDFNDDILGVGVAYWVELVRRMLGGDRNK